MERSLGRCGYLDLGLGSRKERCGTPGRCNARQIVRYVWAKAGRSDGGHESNPSCQTITKVSSICRVEAVLVMGIYKRVKETQNHNTILKTLQEYTGDQVV